MSDYKDMLDADPKLCGCGRRHDGKAWAALPPAGEHADEYERLELRNCPCGSTLAVVVERGLTWIERRDAERIVAALVLKAGGEVTLTEVDIMRAIDLELELEMGTDPHGARTFVARPARRAAS